MMIKLNDYMMNHVNATASAFTATDTKSKKPGDVKMNRLVISPEKNYRVRIHSKDIASTSTVEAVTSTKFKIPMDAKMKGPLHMEEEVEDYRVGIHSKRFVDDVKNAASTSMATSVEPKNAPIKFKKAKIDFRNQVNSAGRYTGLIKPTATRFNEGKKPVDKLKIRQQLEKLQLSSYVNAEGKPTCPICRKSFVSNIPLYQHMDIHSNLKWETCFTSRGAHINQSGENHNHEAVLVDLTKCFSGWNVVKKKRNRLGSRPVNMEYDEEVCAAADILILMANDHFSQAKRPETSMRTQMDIEAAKGLMYLGDHPHSPMAESSVQVPTSITEMQTDVHEFGDTVNGGIKEVRDFDLNEPPAMEEDT